MKLERRIGNTKHMDNLITYLSGVEIPDNGLFVTVSDYEEVRTLEQNSYMWRVAYQPIAEQVGEANNAMLTKDDVHHAMTKMFAPRVERKNWMTGEIEYVPKSTRKFTRKEMSDYLERVFAWGASHGVWFDSDG